MKFFTDYRLEKFIKSTRYDDLPDSVKERLDGCFLDLLGALIVGSGSAQFQAGMALARRLSKEGDIAVVGSEEKFDFFGAAIAMGHSSNAYDIDDGHNMIRAHPGTSFIGALLAEGYGRDLSARDFLATLYVSYEVTIRMGAAIMDYYHYAHSSGTFGAVGVAVGVGRMRDYTLEQLNNVLSIAEFNAPLVPGIRSVEYPSMNKDGVPFGVMTGCLALTASECGFLGNKNLLESEEYRRYLDDLGEKHEVNSLYFKPYPCCRWAHPAIDACLALIKEYHLTCEQIEGVEIQTFYKATQLSKIIPENADEAQYNVAYPVAAAIVHNGFSIAQVENTGDKRVHEMMRKLSFVCDEDLDKQFPAKRLCRAKFTLKDGTMVVSKEHQPRGEAEENVSFEWLKEKFFAVTKDSFAEAAGVSVCKMVKERNYTIRALVDFINEKIKK